MLSKQYTCASICFYHLQFQSLTEVSLDCVSHTIPLRNATKRVKVPKILSSLPHEYLLLNSRFCRLYLIVLVLISAPS